MYKLSGGGGGADSESGVLGGEREIKGTEHSEGFRFALRRRKTKQLIFFFFLLFRVFLVGLLFCVLSDYSWIREFSVPL